MSTRAVSSTQVSSSPVYARVLEDTIISVQIPPNVREGETFQVTPVNGSPFSVVVPKGVAPGSFVNIALPVNSVAPAAAAVSSDDTSCQITMNKTVLGAAVAGCVVGSIFLGVIGGVVIAGACGYAASVPSDSKVSRTMRKVGDATIKGIAESSEWIADRMNESSDASSSQRINDA